MVAITYARSRLWLGIFGVGSIVLTNVYLLAFAIPLRFLPETQSWSGVDLTALMMFIGIMVASIAPLDLLGGFILPNRFRPESVTAGMFIRGWVRGVVVQTSFFLAMSLFILAMGRWAGLPGAVLAVLVVSVVLIAFQLQMAKLTAFLTTRLGDLPDSAAVIAGALRQTSDWGLKSRPIVVLEHDDIGFTGGIVGLPGMETIVIPATWVKHLLPEQLAVTIARRLEVVQSGSRTRGLLLAFAWVIAGFALSALLPGAGVTSVGELAMTCMGFTIWTFLGLLTLPTLNRQASYAIDRRVIDRGAAAERLYETLRAMDRLQDDEPNRSPWIERIFHPVPSVDNRRNDSASTSSSVPFPIAWHAARMTLYLSWSCMGLLVRAVHCNVGRPELWVLLPTD